MAFPAVTIPAKTTVDDAVRLFFHRHPFRAFPVVDGPTTIGLLTIDRVDEVALPDRATTSVDQVVETHPDLFINEHSGVAELLDRPEFHRVRRAVVMSGRGDVGILSMTQIDRALARESKA